MLFKIKPGAPCKKAACSFGHTVSLTTFPLSLHAFTTVWGPRVKLIKFDLLWRTQHSLRVPKAICYVYPQYILAWLYSSTDKQREWWICGSLGNCRTFVFCPCWSKPGGVRWGLGFFSWAWSHRGKSQLVLTLPWTGLASGDGCRVSR